MFDYWNTEKKSTSRIDPEIQRLYETEMCDVCGRSYYYKNIYRYHYLSTQGVHYAVRCCPYCNAQDYCKQL